MNNIFLTARWENLIIISYQVDPLIIQKYLPEGLVPHTLNGSAFISLVAFDFLDTKVLGIKIPFNVNFPEINLRTYVRCDSRTSVIFINEFVPKTLVAFGANFFYNENYRRAKMYRTISSYKDIIKIKHYLKLIKSYSIELTARNNQYTPDENSAEHFFKEHSWGFACNKKGNLTAYRVMHPVWDIYPVTGLRMDFRFGEIYGDKWKFIDDSKPYNICFTAGSEIKIFNPLIRKQIGNE